MTIKNGKIEGQNSKFATESKTGKFSVPINVKMSVNASFRAPVTVNLTYNNSASEVEPLEQVTAADLQRYICEQLKGQCETVPEGCPGPVEPAPRKSDCTQINVPIRDRKAYSSVPTNNPADAKKKTGVAEVPIEDQIKDAIVREFGFPRDKIVSVTPFKSCYNHYAIGTTGDVTFVAWVHQDGYIHTRKQTW